MAVAITLTATSSTSTTHTATWSSSYTYIWLQYSTIYTPWTTISSSLSGSDNYEQTVTPNITYTYRANGSNDGATWSGWSDTASATSYADTVLATLSLAGSSTDVTTSTAVSDTVSATINFSAYSLEAQSISTNYAHYLAASTGVVYQYSPDYKGDAGEAIPCYWQSKDTNFVDQYRELENRQKNVHFVRLYYVDTDSSVATTVKLSTDGGVTWDGTSTQSIGTGNGKNKSVDFYFEDGPVSGHSFLLWR
jgi:hypothetical protein